MRLCVFEAMVWVNAIVSPPRPSPTCFEFKTTVMFSSGSKHTGNRGKHVSNPLAGLGTTCSHKMDQCSFWLFLIWNISQESFDVDFWACIHGAILKLVFESCG